MALAAAGGLSAASVGAIASALGMSKSAVFAHFGSKTALDRALLDAAADRVARAIIQPANGAPQGIARLIALTEAWLAQPPDGPLALLASNGPGLDSTVLDGLRTWRSQWLAALELQFAHAVRAGELAAGTDAKQGAFETLALLMAAERGRELGDTQATARARHAIEALVHRLSAAPEAQTPAR